MKPGDRLLAWFYTGPVGHLFGTLADIVVLWVRWGASVARVRISRRTRVAE
jgi:hypothetical protein